MKEWTSSSGGGRGMQSGTGTGTGNCGGRRAWRRRSWRSAVVSTAPANSGRRDGGCAGHSSSGPEPQGGDAQCGGAGGRATRAGGADDGTADLVSSGSNSGGGFPSVGPLASIRIVKHCRAGRHVIGCLARSVTATKGHNRRIDDGALCISAQRRPRAAAANAS